MNNRPENNRPDYSDNLSWWSENVGNFEPDIFSDYNERKFFLSLFDIESVNNCEFVTAIPNDINNSFTEAYAIYDNSPFLKERFERKNIKLLLTCEYVG